MIENIWWLSCLCLQVLSMWYDCFIISCFVTVIVLFGIWFYFLLIYFMSAVFLCQHNEIQILHILVVHIYMYHSVLIENIHCISIVKCCDFFLFLWKWFNIVFMLSKSWMFAIKAIYIATINVWRYIYTKLTRNFHLHAYTHIFLSVFGLWSYLSVIWWRQ